MVDSPEKTVIVHAPLLPYAQLHHVAQFTWLDGYMNQFLLCIFYGVYKLGNFHIINLGNFHICEIMPGTIRFGVDVTKHGEWASSVSNPLKLKWHFDKVIRLSYTLKF